MSRIPIDHDWFKKQILEKGLSQREFYIHVGIAENALYRILSGKQPIRLNEASQMASCFGVSLYDLLRRAGIDPPVEGMTLPIAGSVNGALDVTPSAKYPPVTSIPLVEQSTVGLICDDSGSPFYGWIFAYIPASDIEQSAIGRLSVVKLSSGKMLIRFLNPGLHVGKFDLTPINGPPFTNFVVFTASPVLFIRPAHGA
jgi:hypothetical protein